jgi:uncharacterized membrane protein YeaQ/YmgE (transglycosylase-associated protein family)
MSVLTWLVAGGLVGWGVSRYMTTLNREAIAFNVVVAVLGAAMTGLVVAPLLGVPPGFGVFALFVSVCGAAALLSGVHFFRQTVAS